MSQDVWSESKLDVLDVLESTDFTYYVTDNQKTQSKSDSFSVDEMTEMKMIIDARPRYPSNKLSFTIANITKDKPIRFFNIYLNLNEQFDVDVVLENSQRNLLNSFTYTYIIFCLNLITKTIWCSHSVSVSLRECSTIT